MSRASERRANPTMESCGIVCVASGGTCIATGHRCTGLVCNIAGCGTGTRGPPARPLPADAGVCALYGPGCNEGTPCCNGVPCTDSPTNAVCTGLHHFPGVVSFPFRPPARREPRRCQFSHSAVPRAAARRP
jgi:hypothetical protein